MGIWDITKDIIDVNTAFVGNPRGVKKILGAAGLDPSAGYETAAAAAETAKVEFNELAADVEQQFRDLHAQGKISLQQYQQAIGEFERYRENPTELAGWYNRYSRFYDPSNVASNGVFRQVQINANTPSRTDQATQRLQGDLYGPTSTENQYNKQKDSAPGTTSMEDLYNLREEGGQTSEQGKKEVENLSGPTRQGELYDGGTGLETPGLSEESAPGLMGQAANSGDPAMDAYKHSRRHLSGPTQSQMTLLNEGDNLRAAADKYTDYADKRLNSRGEGLASGAGVDLFTDNRMAGAYDSATNLGDYAKRNLSNLEGPSGYENFVRSALENDNPYLDRARQKGAAAMDQRLAASGKYASGGAIQKLGDFHAAQDAEVFKYYNDMARDASSMELQRLQQGADLAGAASGEAIDRGNAFLNLGSVQQGLESDLQDSKMGAAVMQFQNLTGAANAADAAKVAGVNAMTGAGAAASGAALGGATGAAGIGQGADGSEVNRVTAQGDLAAGADTEESDRAGKRVEMVSKGEGLDIDRNRSAADVAQGQDRITMEGNDLLMKWSEMDDEGRRAQVGLTLAAAAQGDQVELNNLKALIESGQVKDAQTLQFLAGGQGAAGSLDEQTLNNLLGEISLKGDLAGREKDLLNLLVQGLTLGSTLKGSGINAGVNAGALEGQGQNAFAKAYLDIAGSIAGSAIGGG